MLNVGIIGVTGYAGEELLDILLQHDEVRVKNISAKIDKPQKISEIFPRFRDRCELLCAEPDLKQILKDCDLIFLALPHTVSMQIAPKLLRGGKKVIDLSADYRFKDAKLYERYYKTKQKDKTYLAQAVYGLPELYRLRIKNARLIANPGCYPTAAILALAPLAALDLIDRDSIIIDAKSGVSGAGRKVAESFLFCEVNEDFKAYKVNIHQHAPEIVQILSKLSGRKVNAIFVPHLLPLNRGILETIYVKKLESIQSSKLKNLIELYKRFYSKEPFVRIKDEGKFPGIRDVAGTNFCDIGIKDEGKNIIIISAIDNLRKGASGQAVQNMNIMYKFPEEMGLV